MDDLLIATWQKVFVRYADGTERLIRDTLKPFYGLTWNESAVFVGCRAWDQEERREQLAVYDRDWKLLELQEIPTDGQLHQILWLPVRQCLVLTDTLHDRLIFWDAEKKSEIGRVELGVGNDDHHVNSLWVNDRDRIFACGLYGETWVEGMRDHNFYASWEYPYELHNLAIIDNSLYLGTSDQESLLVDSANGEPRFLNLTEHLGVTHDANDLRHCYTRGLAVSPTHIYVGAAAVQDERNERWQGNCAIAVFDREFQFVEGLRFENAGGMHDIRVLGTDLAHNGVMW